MKSITIDLTEGKFTLSTEGKIETHEIIGALEQMKILFVDNMLKKSYELKNFERKKEYLIEFYIWQNKQSKETLKKPICEVINLFLNRENEI